MDAQAGLLVDLEEDLGLSELAPENDQRTSVFLLHLALIRVELGFLGALDSSSSDIFGKELRAVLGGCALLGGRKC